MASWSSRSCGYQLGIVVLFFGTASFFVGFVSPYWIKVDIVGTYELCGLWMKCVSNNTENTENIVCSFLLASSVEDWLKTVQVLQCLCFIGLFLSIVYTIVVNFCLTRNGRSRVLEVMCCLGGVAGLIGITIYVFEEKAMIDYISWAFRFNLAGCILGVIAGIIIFVSNRPNLTIEDGAATCQTTQVTTK